MYNRQLVIKIFESWRVAVLSQEMTPQVIVTTRPGGQLSLMANANLTRDDVIAIFVELAASLNQRQQLIKYMAYNPKTGKMEEFDDLTGLKGFLK